MADFVQVGDIIIRPENITKIQRHTDGTESAVGVNLVNAFTAFTGEDAQRFWEWAQRRAIILVAEQEPSDG